MALRQLFYSKATEGSPTLCLFEFFDFLFLFSRNTSPASVPYLFASLKIGITASLVGAIVGELPTGAVRGLGARLLAGSYYGQTIQIWSALLSAAVLAALLVALINLVQQVTLKRMGML